MPTISHRNGATSKTHCAVRYVIIERTLVWLSVAVERWEVGSDQLTSWQASARKYVVEGLVVEGEAQFL